MSRRLPARCKRCTRCPLAIDTGCRLRTLEAPARLFAVWPRVQMYTADCPAKQPRASQIAVAVQVKQAASPPPPTPPLLPPLPPFSPTTHLSRSYYQTSPAAAGVGWAQSQPTLSTTKVNTRWLLQRASGLMRPYRKGGGWEGREEEGVDG